jgi:Na+-transporting NADH:ubiquinone oxidoreductase subunit B/electron transport complex protein RnfD
MNFLKSLLGRLSGIKILRSFRTIFETLEGILFGTPEVTPGAPHIRDHIEIKRYMSTVILAVLPATIASVVFFGWAAVKIILASYITGGVIEVIFAIVRKKDIEEGFLVTGLLFPLVLPPTVPLWVVVVGMAFGVFFGKEVFGGTGRNIFNPALTGRLFITIAFPGLMSANWRAPFADAITSATPLAVFKSSQAITPYLDLLWGQTAGSMGELFRLGIIVGGLFLILTKVSSWRIPLCYLGTAFLLSLAGNAIWPSLIAPPVFQLLSGSILFGAMFMATDPVTSPFTRAGKYIYGTMCGVLTILIRSFSGYTEGVMFSIILMNALTPLIDHIILSVKYRETAK